MQLETLGIDESVSVLAPPTEFVEELQDLPIATVVLDGESDPATECDAVVTFQYRDSFLSLEWIHSIQAGVDRFPHDRLREADVVLTNSTGIHGDAVGEAVAGYVLAFARRLHEHVAHQQRGTWSRPEWHETWTVAGETACVIGLGSLGRGVVDRLTGLGLDVVGVRRTPTPEPGVDRVYTPENLQQAVSDARFVVASVPLTDRTEGMIDEAVLAAMRSDAYLLNVARGDVVEQDALVDALEADAIAGAALDVFETEPLPESSPLWGMDEVIVSPHCAGLSDRYHADVSSIVAENVRRIRAGEPFVNRFL